MPRGLDIRWICTTMTSEISSLLTLIGRLALQQPSNELKTNVAHITRRDHDMDKSVQLLLYMVDCNIDD